MKRTPLLYWLLALAVLMPSAARATGSLAIPNTIGAQSGPNISASLLDTNWTTIAAYVNAREVTTGSLGARPVASTAGRWYFATDDNGGTLYVDTGSTWTQVSPTIYSGKTRSAITGLSGATATATNTQYNVSANIVTLRNPTTGTTYTQTATATLTNNVLTSGPAANGRDQAGTFSVSSWVHFYYIWNGSTLATLSSTCAPDTTTGNCPTVGGPNLPTGYTHWAYIGPVRFATAGTLNATWINGAVARTEPSTIRIAAAGTGAEQSWDLSDRIPPNHRGAYFTLMSNANGVQGDIRVASGGRVGMTTNIGGIALGSAAVSDLVPLASQTLYFFGNGGASFGIQLTGYMVPNGGE